MYVAYKGINPNPFPSVHHVKTVELQAFNHIRFLFIRLYCVALSTFYNSYMFRIVSISFALNILAILWIFLSHFLAKICRMTNFWPRVARLSEIWLYNAQTALSDSNYKAVKKTHSEVYAKTHTDWKKWREKHAVIKWYISSLYRALNVYGTWIPQK